LKRKGDGRRGKTDDPGEVFLRERVEEEKVCELRKSWEFGKQEVVREGQT
jgi:hypothetical protein